MPYVKQGPFVSLSPPAINAGHLNAIETQYDTAMADVENATLSVTRDTTGLISSVTANGITSTITRDSSGRVSTVTRAGVTKTISRDSSGRVTGIA